jgi:hypothetical protein
LCTLAITIIKKNPCIYFWIFILNIQLYLRSLWQWSYGSWIYNYLCNQYLSLLMLWVRISIRASRGVQHYVIKFVSDLRQVGDFLRVLRFPPPIAEISLKVALNTIKKITNQLYLAKVFKCSYSLIFCRIDHSSPPVFGGVCHLFIFCVFFCLSSFCVLWFCVSNVAIVSGLSILHLPFGFL